MFVSIKSSADQPFFNHREICHVLSDTPIFCLESHVANHFFFAIQGKSFLLLAALSGITSLLLPLRAIWMHTFLVSTVLIFTTTAVAYRVAFTWQYGYTPSSKQLDLWLVSKALHVLFIDPALQFTTQSETGSGGRGGRGSRVWHLAVSVDVLTWVLFWICLQLEVRLGVGWGRR